MRYTSLAAFETAFSFHPVYLVSCLYDADRMMILKRIATRLKLKYSAEEKRWNTSNFAKEILPLTKEKALFTTNRIFLSYETQIEEEALLRYIERPDPQTFLLLGTKETKSLADAAKKDVAWLDLSQEKPWEKEKRLLTVLQEQISQASKIALPDLLPKLLERIGTDWQTLSQELSKLIAFSGNKKEISSKDLEQISSSPKTKTLWQISEEIIWGKTAFLDYPVLDNSEALTLLGALRYQVQLGLQLHCHPNHAPLPSHIKPYQAQKYGQLAKFKPQAYFEQGLLALFEIEQLLKTSSVNPRLLFSCFSLNLFQNTPK